MNTEILNIDSNKPARDLTTRCAETIDSGGLIAIPTETAYTIACKAAPEPLDKINRILHHPDDLTLHIGTKQKLKNFVPSLRLRQKKLIKNFWPGPLTVIFHLSESQVKSMMPKLTPQTAKILYKDNNIAVRCPDNAVAADILNKCKNPVVAAPVIIEGQPASSAKQITKAFQDQLDIIVNSTQPDSKNTCTVVKSTPEKIEIIRQGVIPEDDITELSKIDILFVCTGNSCRSPMAEGIFSHLIAQKFNCGVDEVENFGYKIASAGTMGISGLPVSPEAVIACAAKGIDISMHKSSALTQKRIENADLIFAMTRDHLNNIISMAPEARQKSYLLSRTGDISDPIGKGQDQYYKCAEQIESALKERMSELKI